MSGGGKSTGSSSRSGAGPGGGNPKSKGGGGGGGSGGAAEDPCDRDYDVSLTSVDVSVAPLVQVGERLRVELRRDGDFESVVCTRRGGAHVGAIAGVGGLAQLRNCLRDGRTFEATVTARSGTASVTVHVALTK